LSHLELEPVKRVRQALSVAGHPDHIRELSDAPDGVTAAAKALSVDPGAMVQVQVFTIGLRYVVVLMAGDRQCDPGQLPKVFQLQGDVVRPGADLVRAVTGFSLTAMPPVGWASKLPTAIDASLKRFETLYTLAGHPECVFETSVDALKSLTGGVVSYALAVPAQPPETEHGKTP